MIKNMKHFLTILAFFIFLLIGFRVYASSNNLVLVYPYNGAVISANSTFFVGHTNPDATLTINEKPVKVYSNGSFVRVHDLQKGRNIIELKSILGNEIKTKKIELVVLSSNYEKIKNKEFLRPTDAVFQIIKDEVPVRELPYGNRLTPTKKGALFRAVGEINNHYKFLLSDNRSAYILKNSAQINYFNKLEKQVLEDIYFNEDLKNIIITIPIKNPVIAQIETKENILKVKLNDSNLAFKDYCVKSPYIKTFSFDENSFTLELLSNKFNGYDYFYENNKFILKMRKPFKKGLRDKIIAIDAGHGGKELGAIGPTEVPEKDINIKIANYLKEILEKEGAKIIMTRNEDEYVDLYERVEIAQKNDADILISIHNNSLPDGKNPYLDHGTSTYYYHSQGLLLAQKIQESLLKSTEFKNHGIHNRSFVLTRPTLPVSVLVEVGFMINPFEYEKLLIPSYQKKYALGIKHGIEKYFEL